jgi:asparagine synthase (glutamine-hydrolysing)
MCGICGIYHFDEMRAADEATLRRMAKSIQHRGPDDEGYLFDRNLGLGHLRLSIIDLSEAAHQPMSDESGRYSIIYNGEIYNYLELREQLVKKGAKFFSNSDTEVILRLYLDEGPEALKKLNGMFAFVIWDKVERTLFAARDRLGIKPFYYYQNAESFTFASEIKALFQSGIVDPQLNPDGLAEYLTFQFCCGKTLFKDIRKLEPGCWMTISRDGETRIQKYWDLDFSVDTNHTTTILEPNRSSVEDAYAFSCALTCRWARTLAAWILPPPAWQLGLDAPIHTFSGGLEAAKNMTRHALHEWRGQAGSIRMSLPGRTPVRGRDARADGRNG